MKISACIVSYNSISSAEKKEEFTRCISSVLSNTKGDFKLYVVDNASSDSTAEYVKEKFPEVQVIKNENNLGFGAAHNVVIPLLDSDYHFIINPDIELRDDAINSLCEFMQSHEDAGGVNPDIRYPSGEAQPLAKRQPKLKYLFANHFSSDRESNPLVREYCMMDSDFSKPVRVENLSGCFIGIRTDLFKSLNGFDDRYFMYFEDFDLARRIMQTASLYYVPEAVVYHSWERDSKKSKKLLSIHIGSMIKYFLKWH